MLVFGGRVGGRHADLSRACATLRAPDQRLAEAVEARQQFDIRAGAAFTRWMSVRYHRMFPERARGGGIGGAGDVVVVCVWVF